MADIAEAQDQCRVACREMGSDCLASRGLVSCYPDQDHRYLATCSLDCVAGISCRPVVLGTSVDDSAGAGSDGGAPPGDEPVPEQCGCDDDYECYELGWCCPDC